MHSVHLNQLDVTVRPNLNQKGHTTIHKGRLGKKLDSLKEGLIVLEEEIVYKKTLEKIKKGLTSKTVCAGLRGTFIEHHPLLVTGFLLPIRLDMDNLRFDCVSPLKRGTSFILTVGLFIN